MDVRLKSQWQEQEPRQASASSSGLADPSSPYKAEEATIRWTKLGKLSQILYPTASPYGRPTVFICSSKHLLIGTDSADVLVFDYEQRLVAQLSTISVNSRLGEVTCLSISDDETHVVAGFSQGWVCLWDLEAPPKNTPKLRAAVAPLKPDEVPARHSRIQTHESHVAGIAIQKVSFIRHKNTAFVSVDAGGLAILHKHHRVLLEHTTKSRRIFGSFTGFTRLLDALIFETYIAILTADLLLIVQLGDDSVTTCLKVPRSRDNKDEDTSHGTLKYNAFTKQLAYSWGFQLKVLSLDSESSTFTADKAYTHGDPIEWFDWLDESYSMLVICSSSSRETRLHLVLVNDALLVDSEPLSPSAHLIQLQASTLTLVAMGRYEFSVGQLTNWADRLLALLNNAHPTKAIELALSYYANEGNLAILGLPAERSLRQRVIRSAFSDIALTALRFSIEFDFESLKTLLPTIMKAAVIINTSLLESILEIINSSGEQWIHDLFLDTLVASVLSRQLLALSPAVFRELIMYRYGTQEIFYLLDLSGLDVDLAFKICSQHPELSEVEIYLKNQTLRDYLSPLSPPTRHTMGYLALTLTGRVYPTGNFVSDIEVQNEAKADIYTALFLSETTSLLQAIINFDERAFFIALNEAFEDSFLNDNSAINRQIIVNILQSSSLRTPGIHYQIFLARNYPKYRQFIILPGQAVDDVCRRLSMDKSEPTESQLALLSLLSVHQPADSTAFINALKDANFTLVLEAIYRKEGKFKDLMLLKLRNHEPDLWNVIEEGLLKDKVLIMATIHEHAADILAEDPAQFAKVILSQHPPSSFWLDILSIADQTSKMDFLNATFAMVDRSGGFLPPLAVRTQYVSLLATQGYEGHGMLMSALQKTLTGPDDIQLPLVVDDLLENDHVDALALILCRKSRQNEAMIYILNHIPSVQGSELSRYVTLAISICLEMSRNSPSECPMLWKRLMETLMSLDNDKALAELQKVIQALSESRSTSIIDLASGLIASGQKAAAPLVTRLFLDLHRQEHALRCFRDILQADAYKQLIGVLSGRAQGWVVNIDSDCEVCGRKIAGLGIDAQSLYQAWEQSGKNEPLTADCDTLIAFQCRHTYHYRCLARMTGNKLDNPAASRECILCKNA